MPTSSQQRQRARREVADFLASRRALVSPEQAGLPPGGRRRVPGLRREEVALLAGISVDYYARLERGLVGAVSDPVVAGLARVLRLDAVESAHLAALVRAATADGPSAGGAGAEAPSSVPESLRHLVDGMTNAAVFVRNARLDVLAHNRRFGELYDEALQTGEPPNLLRYLFLDPRSRTFYRNWERLARGAVGSLRADDARAPGDPAVGSLVTELRQQSAEFAGFWRAHAVHSYQSGLQEFRHHRVGDLDLAYETFQVVADPGLTMIAYHAVPGSASQAGFDALLP